ncbi:MAG: SET domain-containing protein [Candidatus Vogelbacteria bacterium]|nr:SET domain-containing protein [Candidatus Vogelbacteria bacterium]
MKKYELRGYKLLVKRSKTGLGLFAGEPIKKGTCIIEYIGRVISEKEEYTSNSKYLFGINSKMTIDGRDRANTARYINHSCHPNADPEIWHKRVFIMAIKNIKPGNEITYDYGKEYWDDHIKPKGCRCTKCHS